MGGGEGGWGGDVNVHSDAAFGSFFLISFAFVGRIGMILLREMMMLMLIMVMMVMRRSSRTTMTNNYDDTSRNVAASCCCCHVLRDTDPQP